MIEPIVLSGFAWASQEYLAAVEWLRRSLCEGAGLNTTQLRTFARIAGSPGIFPKSLADHLGLTMAAVTTLTTTLVDRGFAQRLMSRDDRRRIRLQLTPKGASLVTAIYAEFDSKIRAAARDQSNAQMVESTTLLISIAEKIEFYY